LETVVLSNGNSDSSVLSDRFAYDATDIENLPASVTLLNLHIQHLHLYISIKIDGNVNMRISQGCILSFRLAVKPEVRFIQQLRIASAIIYMRSPRFRRPFSPRWRSQTCSVSTSQPALDNTS